MSSQEPVGSTLGEPVPHDTTQGMGDEDHQSISTDTTRGMGDGGDVPDTSSNTSSNTIDISSYKAILATLVQNNLLSSAATLINDLSAKHYIDPSQFDPLPSELVQYMQSPEFQSQSVATTTTATATTAAVGSDTPQQPTTEGEEFDGPTQAGLGLSSSSALTDTSRIALNPAFFHPSEPHHTSPLTFKNLCNAAVTHHHHQASPWIKDRIITRAVFSPDGAFLALADPTGAVTVHSMKRILDTKTIHGQVDTFHANGQVHSMVFHPIDPVVIVATTLGRILLFDHFNLVKSFRDFDSVFAIDVHPAGQYLLVGGDCPYPKVYDLTTFQCLVSQTIEEYIETINEATKKGELDGEHMEDEQSHHQGQEQLLRYEGDLSTDTLDGQKDKEGSDRHTETSISLPSLPDPSDPSNQKQSQQQGQQQQQQQQQDQSPQSSQSPSLPPSAKPAPARPTYPTLASLNLHSQPITVVRYSNFAKLYATAGLDGNIILWRTSDGSPIFTIPKAHQGFEITSLVFSPNDQYLLSYGRDNIARLFSVTNGGLVVEYKGCINQYTKGSAWFSYEANHVIVTNEAISGIDVFSSITGETTSKKSEIFFRSLTDNTLTCCTYSSHRDILFLGGRLPNSHNTNYKVSATSEHPLDDDATSSAVAVAIPHVSVTTGSGATTTATGAGSSA